MSRPWLRRRASLAALLLLPGPLPAWAGLRCRQAPTRSSADLAVPGPFGAGVRTFTFVDTGRETPPNRGYPGSSQRTLVTDVWYPAQGAGGTDAPLDASGGPYPIILYGHGFTATRQTEVHLVRHLASRGFVVAAPDFPLSNIAAPGRPTFIDVGNQPGDLRFVLDRLLELSADGTSPLADAIDPARVGAAGLSLGGLTTLLVAYHAQVRDPRVGAAFVMAPPGCFFTPRFFRTTRVPLLIMHGDSDQLVPFAENAGRLFRIARNPRQLVGIRNGSHTGFTAFATAFDQSEHFDLIGCRAIEGTIDTDPGAEFPELGGKENGIALDRRCALPCQDQISGAALGAARHHELTRIAIAAFFEAHLTGDTGARCFLHRGLARENPELFVRGR